MLQTKTIKMLFFPSQKLYIFVTNLDMESKIIEYTKSTVKHQAFRHKFELKITSGQEWMFIFDETSQIVLQFPTEMLIVDTSNITKEVYKNDLVSIVKSLQPIFDKMEDADSHKFFTLLTEISEKRKLNLFVAE